MRVYKKRCFRCIVYITHQVKFISFNPVGPAPALNLSFLYTHKLVSIPGDGSLSIKQCNDATFTTTCLNKWNLRVDI